MPTTPCAVLLPAGIVNLNCESGVSGRLGAALAGLLRTCHVGSPDGARCIAEEGLGIPPALFLTRLSRTPPPTDDAADAGRDGRLPLPAGTFLTVPTCVSAACPTPCWSPCSSASPVLLFPSEPGRAEGVGGAERSCSSFMYFFLLLSRFSSISFAFRSLSFACVYREGSSCASTQRTDPKPDTVLKCWCTIVTSWCVVPSPLPQGIE
mmetsp:Transcript_41720/g.104247  ORF Transcript_41720/g.104247 Transcript_41720/m.104247 type:complete len:208 (+) Transcript_41720:557-1180(+)